LAGAGGGEFAAGAVGFYYSMAGNDQGEWVFCQNRAPSSGSSGSARFGGELAVTYGLARLYGSAGFQDMPGKIAKIRQIQGQVGVEFNVSACKISGYLLLEAGQQGRLAVQGAKFSGQGLLQRASALAGQIGLQQAIISAKHHETPPFCFQSRVFYRILHYFALHYHGE